MITIDREYNQFKVKVSNPVSGWRGFSVYAKTIEQLHEVINHCYGVGHGCDPVDNCPLCQKEK